MVDDEAPSTAASGRRRRQRGRDSVTSHTGDELPGGRLSVGGLRSTAGAVPLWTAGDRAPLLPVADLRVDIDEQLDPRDAARASDVGGAPDGEAPPPAGGAGGGAAARGITSRYVQDSVSGEFVRAHPDAEARRREPPGASDTLLATRGGALGADGLTGSSTRAVEAALTGARGLLAGLSLMHMLLLAPTSALAERPTAFVVYAPIALHTHGVFQALVGISIVATLDAHFVYSPDARAQGAHAASARERALVAAARGSFGTALVGLLYGAALLIGMLQTPIEHTLYVKYALRRLGVDSATGALNADESLASTRAVEWDTLTGEDETCAFALLTCAAFPPARAALYRGLGLTRDVCCLLAWVLAAVLFAVRRPPPPSHARRMPPAAELAEIRAAPGWAGGGAGASSGAVHIIA